MINAPIVKIKTVWISQAVHDLILESGQEKFPLETGGVLMGYLDSTRTELVISDASTAGSNALHYKHAYIPDYEYDNAYVEETYAASGRVHTYLGDWHTHPKGSCKMSFRDKLTLNRIGKDKDNLIDVPVMLIASIGTANDEFGVYQMQRYGIFFSMHSPIIEYF